MKYSKGLITLTLFCLLSFSCLHAQGPALPTIGQVYNYSPGDSFLYKLTDLNTDKVIMYVNRVVLSRDDAHYPDSLIYEIQEIFLDTNALNPAVWDTLRIAYHHCNDTIFPPNGFIICQHGPDSCAATSPISIVTDTLFPGMTIYHADYDCFFWNYGWNNAAVGLGIVHAYNACGDFVLEQYDIAMVHHYKNTTGIPSSFENIQFTISPNPAGTMLNLNTSQSIIGSYITISDIAGRKILLSEVKDIKSNIEISGLPRGVYVVTVTDGQRSATQKLIISH